MVGLPSNILDSAFRMEDKNEDEALGASIRQQVQDAQAPTPSFKLPDLGALLGIGGGEQQAAENNAPILHPAAPAASGWKLPDLSSLLGPSEPKLPQTTANSPQTSPAAMPSGAATARPVAMPTGAPPATGDLRAYTRAKATSLGIDPDIAERVAMSEGGFDDPVRQSDVVYQGQREQSYGPFQMNVNGGLGATAIQRGHDPRDPANVYRNIDFALDEAVRGGWGPFHGAARVGIGPRQGIGAVAPGPAPAAPTQGRSAPPVAEQPEGQTWAAGSYTPNQITAATGEGLDYETALAVCGPAAAIAFARRNGRNPTMQEAVGLARQVGWTAAQGMAGPGSQQRLLSSMGIAARLTEGVPDWRAVAADVQRGNPVIVSTPGHYFVAERYDPESGAFDFGQSAGVLKASKGRTWFRPEELSSLGMGAASASLFMDSPQSPTPSVVAGRSAPTAGAPSPAVPPSSPAGAPPAGDSPDTVTIQHVDNGQQKQVKRSDLPGWMKDIYPGSGPLWRVVEGAPVAQASALDEARTQTGGGETMARQPLSQQPELPADAVQDFMPGDGGTAPTLPYDPDQGPREATPGSAGARPVQPPPQYGPDLPPVSQASAEEEAQSASRAPQPQPQPVTAIGAVQNARAGLEQDQELAPRAPAAPPWAPAARVYGETITDANARQTAVEAGREQKYAEEDPKVKEFWATVNAPVDVVNRTMRVVNDVLLATPKATADTIDAALSQVGLGRDTIGLDLPVVGRIGAADIVDIKGLSFVGTGNAARMAANPTVAGRVTAAAVPSVLAAAKPIEDLASAGMRAGAEAVQGAGQRVRGAVAANAQRTAAADARMDTEGSVTAPGALGVAMGTDAQPMVRGRVIPPDVADELDFPIRPPTDPRHIRAIEAAGGTVDERGVTVNVIRNQGAEAAGGVATRGAPFYIAGPKGMQNPYAQSTSSAAGVGGPQRIEGETRFRSPLIISDPPGEARGFDDAMRQMGHSEHPEIVQAKQAVRDANDALTAAYNRSNDLFTPEIRAQTGMTRPEWNRTPEGAVSSREIDVAQQARTEAQRRLQAAETAYPSATASNVEVGIKEAKRAGPAGSPERSAALKALVSKHGGDPDLIDDLMALRGADMGESVYAVKENIVSHNARAKGYDGVLTVQEAGASADTIMADPAYIAAQKVADDADAALGQAYKQGDQSEIARLRVEVEQAQANLQAVQEEIGSRGRITELMDPREARNPTPGAPNPRIAEAERAIADARREIRAEEQQKDYFYQQNPNATVRDFDQAYPDIARRVDAAYDRLGNATDELRRIRESEPDYTGAPGYTLRSDIPRRPQDFDELSRRYQAAQERWRNAPNDAEGAAAEAEMKRLQQELIAARRGGTGSEQASASAGALPATRGTGALSTVNRAASEAIVGGTGGAVIEQARNPEEDPRTAAGRGFALGAAGFPVAGRLARGAARAAGRSADGGGGAMATLGAAPNQPPRRGRGQDIPGQQPITLTPGEEVSRLRLDKFPEEVRDLIEDGAKGLNWARAQRRGVLPDAVVQQQAGDDLRSVDQLIKGGKIGRAYNAEETVALRNATASQAQAVRDLSEEIADARAAGMTPDLLIARRAAEATRLNGLIQIAEGARAEAGRTLRQYRQQANLIELNPEQAIQQIYRKLGGKDNAAEAVDEYTKLVQDGATPIQLAKFWAKVEGGKITGSDLFSLYRRFSMLSGPRTVEVNALSGAVNLTYEVLSAALGQAARLRGGEAVAEIAAPIKASGRAFKNMAETMWHGVSAEQAARGDIPRTLSSRTDNTAAKGALTVMETPDRFNAAVDQFFRTMTEDWAATRLAHQQVRADGIRPSSKAWAETVAQKLEAIREDPSKFPQIKEMADRVAFSDEPGPIGKGLEAFREKAPLMANLLFPFIRTPYNIASRAIDLSPIGIVRTGIETATGAGRGTKNISQRLRDNAIGTGAAVWAYGQAQQGNVTGAGPDDPEKRAALEETGWRRYSVKIGGEYWSYANFAPFSLALSAGAAAHEAKKYAKPGKDDALSMFADGAARTGKVVADMTVLAGIGAIIKAQEDPDRYGTAWLTQFLQTLIPAGSALNTVGQATDTGGVRRADRDTFENQVRGGLAARLPDVVSPLSPIGTRKDVPIAQGPLGDPVPNNQTGIRALNPFRPSPEVDAPIARAYLDAGIDIGKPPPSFTSDGVKIELTPDQQRAYQRYMGDEIKKGFSRANGASSRRRTELLQDLYNEARDKALTRTQGDIGRSEIRQRVRSGAGR